MTPREGVDYVSGPSPAALKRAGKDFVCRYVSTPGNPKNITKTEVKFLQKANIDIVIVFETTAARSLAGYSAGVYDATSALEQAKAAGGPADSAIYFAVDFDATEDEQLVINRYLLGAAHVLGKNKVGVYGGIWVVKRALEAGICKYGWQTYAWSGGRLYEKAHIYQYKNGVYIAGANCDLDRAYRADFGQWYYEPPKPIGPQDEEPYWQWLRWQLGEGEYKNHGSDPKWRPLSLPKRVPASWWIRKIAFLAARKMKHK